MNHVKASKIANDFREWIKDLCLDVEVVGSVKRGDKVDVDDIELLLILDPEKNRVRAEFGMFKTGEKKSLYSTQFAQRLHTGTAPYKLKQAIHKADGEKLKRFALADYSTAHKDFCIEFWIVRPETWGIQNVLRTGPREFSQKYVTNIRDGGRLPDMYRYIRGLTQIQQADTGIPLDLPTERDAIAVLGLGWITPSDRHQYG